MTSQVPSEEKTSASFPQSISELEADLENTRMQMSVTIDELVHVLSPSHQIELVKTNVQNVATRLKDDAIELVDNAKTGDQKSILILGGITAGVAAVVGLCIYRIAR